MTDTGIMDADVMASSHDDERLEQQVGNTRSGASEGQLRTRTPKQKSLHAVTPLDRYAITSLFGTQLLATVKKSSLRSAEKQRALYENQKKLALLKRLCPIPAVHRQVWPLEASDLPPRTESIEAHVSSTLRRMCEASRRTVEEPQGSQRSSALHSSNLPPDEVSLILSAKAITGRLQEVIQIFADQAAALVEQRDPTITQRKRRRLETDTAEEPSTAPTIDGADEGRDAEADIVSDHEWKHEIVTDIDWQFVLASLASHGESNPALKKALDATQKRCNFLFGPGDSYKSSAARTSSTRTDLALNSREASDATNDDITRSEGQDQYEEDQQS